MNKEESKNLDDMTSEEKKEWLQSITDIFKTFSELEKKMVDNDYNHFCFMVNIFVNSYTWYEPEPDEEDQRPIKSYTFEKKEVEDTFEYFFKYIIPYGLGDKEFVELIEFYKIFESEKCKKYWKRYEDYKDNTPDNESIGDGYLEIKEINDRINGLK